jgi:NADH:ubiquinone oxidoreductase subunit E
MSDVTEIIEKQIKKYGKKRETLMPVLQSIVEKKHYLTEDSMLEVAKNLEISAAEVYGTASFYSFLDIKERGEFVIRICKSITCDMKGKNEIIKALENKLKIKFGETTPDKKFSLLLTNCIGWCDKSPAMLINDEVYTELTPQKAVKIIQDYYKK